MKVTSPSSIGPGDPNDASYYPPDEFVNDYKPLEGGQPFANTTLAWRVNQSTGALLASVRTNGVDNQDTINGSPVGVIHGVAYFNNNFGQGWGYRMNDGEFANGGNGSSDLQTGLAGTLSDEATFNTSTAYFPYAQGWLGAWVNEDNFLETEFSSSSPAVSTDAVVWGAFGARVEAPEQMSPAAGMLFVAGSDGSSSSDIAAAVPSGDGWDVTIREDSDTDTSGLTFLSESFQFLYVPYTAARLIGGHVDGDGSLIQSAGGNQFDLSRDADGVYRLSVFDSGETKLTGDDGMLILSVASQMGELANVADRSFLSYEYDAETGDFIIESREVASDGVTTPLRDSDFYFAFVDFANPLALFYEADFNEDGAVDGNDFLLWQASFPTAEGATKMDGDANGDGVVDGNDFLVWQSQFGNSTGADIGGGGGSSAVPEPTSIALLLLAAACGMTQRRRV